MTRALTIALTVTAALFLVVSQTQAELRIWQSEALPTPPLPDPPAPFTPSSPSDVSPYSSSGYAPSYPNLPSVGSKWSLPVKGGGTYQPKIRYHHHPLQRKHDLVCLPKSEVVLLVQDPIRCCLAEIPVCIPVCCGSPHIQCGKGLLGRSTVCCDWSCGVSVKIIFRHKGDVLVHYYGI